MRIWLLASTIALSLLALFFPRATPPTATPTAVSQPAAEIHYQRYNLPRSVVHTLVIPNSFPVITTITPGVETVEQLARRSGAIAGLNAGFFDPQNQKTTSYVTVQGQLAADPRQNERLIGNPDLTNYLDKILDRSEFRRYQCGNSSRYAIARHRAAIPTDCRLVDAVGAGPQLLPQSTAEAEGFVDLAIGRDALGSQQPNARTAIGLTHDGMVIWVMAAQQPDRPRDSGLSLPELAAFMQTLGIETALNLDGGSSASLYFKGKMEYGKMDRSGNWVQRSVKSVLLVGK